MVNSGDGERKEVHWDKVWTDHAPTELSWYQASADDTACEIVRLVGTDAAVVDVGAGASPLVDALLDAGVTDVTVVDLASPALERTRARLGARSASVDFVVADVCAWRPVRTFDVWHDRAVFHFLLDEDDKRAYVDWATAAVRPAGCLLLSTFAPDGPDRCSGLEVSRYDAEGLALLFAPVFALVSSRTVIHLTPWGARQVFTCATMVRT